MLNNLYARVALIVALVLLAVGILNIYPLKKGIDLGGGVDLVYELDTAGLPAGTDTAQLAADVISVLKNRVDPYGQKNLTWRVVAGKRIEIQMPLATKATREARAKFNALEEQVRGTNLKQSEIRAVLSKHGAARQAGLQQLAGDNAQRLADLEKLATAFDEQQAVLAEYQKYDPTKLPASLLQKKIDTDATYDQALAAVMKYNIDLNNLNDVLAAADDPNNTAAQKLLDAYPSQHPQQKQLLEKLIAARAELNRLSGGGFDDPADLERMLRGSGVLDFRIAVTPNPADQAAVQQAIAAFQEQGPTRAKLPNMAWFEIDPKNGTSLLDDFAKGNSYYIMRKSGDKTYILLHTNPEQSLTHDPRRPAWKLTNAQKTQDPNGQLAVSFQFDPSGATQFGAMTSQNVGQPMAILLDDKALTAPSIRTAITGGSGQITFGTVSPTHTAAQINQEATLLVNMLKAGSLPATLQPQPISVQVISPTLGQDNITAGLRSGVYAVIAVVGFMFLYYTLAGLFADVAVIINLLILLAVMAMFGATFTLPGIAGVVLTLGMAVDANVLINERIREELHHGASLVMAVRQGYDRVFWTIFDANLTTGLTAGVLIAVGSEEVKGFGVTLLIGLIISMFTALFVTRTLMIIAIKTGVLKQIDSNTVAEYLRDMFTFQWMRGRWPFARVITVGNIDWVGKRHYFWTLSAIITILGIVAFFARGSDKYDMEFNGGTQVTMELTRPMTVEQVRERERNLSTQFAQMAKQSQEQAASLTGDAKDRAQAEASKYTHIARALDTSTDVVAVGETHRVYQIITPISDTQTVKMKDDLVEGVKREFGDVLDIRPALSFKDDDVPATELETVLQDQTVRPITKRFVTDLLPGQTPTDLDQNDLTDYFGGAAVLVDNINPPVTQQDLQERVNRIDLSSGKTLRPEVIPLAYAPAASAAREAASQPAAGASTQPAAPKVTRALVVATDPNALYSDQNSEQWRSNLAMKVWDTTRTALTTSSSLAGVTSFDPVVAGQAKTQAILAIVISLILIVVYVWIRFGGLLYGLGAILSLLHDAIMALAATVLSGWIYQYFFGGHANWLLISDFKINLTAIAAYLTIIGYSVNDTIVVFDRIRENRGRSRAPLTAQLVNDSINQCLGRTIWTTFTVFIVVLILYIWGGEGIRGFAWAMLFGVFTGAYSTLAIASPSLLSVQPKVKETAFPVKFGAPDEQPTSH